MEVCGQNFGSDFNKNSCQNAWQKIERSTSPQGYCHRQDPLTENTPLPIRYLSNDGTCAIDVEFIENVNDATCDGLTISEMAGSILVKCVYLANEGGVGYIPGKKVHSRSAPIRLHDGYSISL